MSLPKSHGLDDCDDILIYLSSHLVVDLYICAFFLEGYMFKVREAETSRRLSTPFFPLASGQSWGNNADELHSSVKLTWE